MVPKNGIRCWCAIWYRAQRDVLSECAHRRRCNKRFDGCSFKVCTCKDTFARSNIKKGDSLPVFPHLKRSTDRYGKWFNFRVRMRPGGTHSLWPSKQSTRTSFINLLRDDSLIHGSDISSPARLAFSTGVFYNTFPIHIAFFVEGESLDMVGQ